MEAATRTTSRLPQWLAWVAPLALIVALVAWFLIQNPIEDFREVPPVEAVAFEQVTFEEGRIELSLRNDGPDPVTVAQVLVNDAYWSYEIGDATLSRLEQTTMTLDYPWEPGLPVAIALVTSTGLTIEHEVEAAALTPAADAATFLTYALLGLFIGVIPVGIGVLWFPALRRAGRNWVRFFLAFTIGLLAFLLLDTVAEGLELAAESPAALDGLGLFALGALFAIGGLVWLQQGLERRPLVRGTAAGLVLAYLVAGGIGLHNLGEGLAVGAALSGGEVALGTFLVLGFAIHNTTEGLAIVAPISHGDDRPSLWHFVALVVLAGAPAIAGTLAGGFAFSAAAAALAFGLAAGAIAQVIWQVGAGMDRGAGLAGGWGVAGLFAGFVFMYATGLLTV